MLQLAFDQYTIRRILLVLLLLLFVSCTSTTSEPDSQFPQDADNAGNDSPPIATVNNIPSPTITMQIAYPVPAPATVTQAGYYPIPTMATESAYIAPPTPSPTWWPTPRPSPVRIEQPTPTVIPARQPSSEASGTLYYATIGGEAHLTLFVAPVVDGEVIERDEEQIIELQDSARFVRFYPSPTNDLLAIIESSWSDGVTILDLEKNKITPIYDNLDNRMPSSWDFHGWHPDGRYFLISNANNFPGLWLVDGLGIEKAIELSEHIISSAAMSLTSQTLAYVYRPKFSNKMLLALAWSDGSHAEVILEKPSASLPLAELSWSPDGTTLAYTRRSSEIWVYSNGVHTRVAGGYKPRTGYTWSPDSRYIAYTARVGADVRVPADIDSESPEGLTYMFSNRQFRIIDVENADVYIPDRQDTMGASSTTPSWSPDGRFAIFTAIHDGRSEIMKVAVDNLESMEVEKMFDSEYMISSAVWIAPVEE